jgi:hypothetical protein
MLELAETRVAVRNLMQKSIEIFDADTHASLGRSENGKLQLLLKLPESKETHERSVRLTERCDDALVQFNFIIDQSTETLRRLQSTESSAGPSRSWCGQVLALLADPIARQGVHTVHRRTSHRWKNVVADLTALSLFKERIATYHLLTRISEGAPKLQSALETEQMKWKQSSKRTAEIASRCSRDVETDRLVIPPKYAKAYSDEMQLREQTQREVQRIERLFRVLGEWARERVGSQQLAGRPEAPALIELPSLPDKLVMLQDLMSDVWLQSTVAALETQLKTSLPIKLQPAPCVR